MNIKTKLSFSFTFIVAAILIFFSAFVYYFSYSNHVSKFRENLLESAKNTAVLLINVVEVDSTLLKKIQQSTILLDDEEVVITDSTNKQIYSNNVHFLTNQLLHRTSRDREVSYFSFAEKDGVYYKHKVNNHTYNVYVMAFDHARRENLSQLREILIWCTIISIILSVFLSYLFSRNAIKPISKIIKSINLINSSKLSSRLEEGKNNDELAQLARSFNEMLAKLDTAFKNQEDFISNASHELRTPLTVMIAESDYALSKEQSDEKWRQHIESMVRDLKMLNTQINSLLELAQLNSGRIIQFSEIRIDEVIINSIQQIKVKYPERKLLLQIQYPENSRELLISGNSGLLEMVFKNLIENACKFSEDNVVIEFRINPEDITVTISDKGIGIPSQELKNVYHPFSRGSNVKYKAGFGVGLSLVSKILELHNVAFAIHSIEHTGTQFEMIFQKTGTTHNENNT